MTRRGEARSKIAHCFPCSLPCLPALPCLLFVPQATTQHIAREQQDDKTSERASERASKRNKIPGRSDRPEGEEKPPLLFVVELDDA